MYPNGNRVHNDSIPCLHCHPSSYIGMVQHLIERCLLLHMTRDACAGALAQHANIPPVVTLIVWGELMKENRSFFKCYFEHVASRRFLYRPPRRMTTSLTLRRKHWRRRKTTKISLLISYGSL